MMTTPKPGNQPDPRDMAIDPDPEAEAHKPADPALAEEEEAAKLGDFA